MRPPRLVSYACLYTTDEFLLNPQVQAQSGTAVPETSWNFNTENQYPNEDCPENDPRPEVGTSLYRLPHYMYSDPDEASYSHRTHHVNVFFGLSATSLAKNQIVEIVEFFGLKLKILSRKSAAAPVLISWIHSRSLNQGH